VWGTLFHGGGGTFLHVPGVAIVITIGENRGSGAMASAYKGI